MTHKIWTLVAAAAAGAAMLPPPAHAVREPAPAAATTPAHARAMWLWSRADPRAVVRWAGAHGVREVFVAVSWRPDAAELRYLRELRTGTRAAGIRLSALGGDPAWATGPGDAVAWRQRATGTGLFDGVHLDVEPYVLPDWKTDQRRIVDGYLAMLDAVRRAGPEPLEVDVPFWLATIPAPAGNLADAVIRRVDAITVMSYRDSSTGIVKVGTDLLNRAQAGRKPVRLAAETQPLADCGYCTFARQSRADLRDQLTAVDAAAGRYRTFRGIAVHDYDSWTRLR